MNKIDLILKLVRENKITDEEAKVLMTTEKEYVYYPSYPFNWPVYVQPYTITYGSGYATTSANITNGDGTITTFTSSSN